MTFENTAAREAAIYDEGLRAYMLGIYNRMFGGLVLTGILAYLASMDPLKGMLFTTVGEKLSYTGLGWVVALAPIVLILGIGFTGGIQKAGPSAFLFWSIAALFGLSLGSVVLLYTGASIALTLFVTAGAFGGLSLFGYTTKKNLNGIGTAAVMAVWGLILLMLVNAFIGSSTFSLLIAAAGIVVFSILVAYDTQKLKEMYDYENGDRRALVNYGALTLYLDFVNLFLFFLRFLGVKVSD